MEKIKQILKIRKIDKNYIYILIISLFVVSPLISKTYYYGDDTAFHAASIIGLSHKNLFNIYNLKIFDYIAGSFGYGEGIFYPQLPHYIAAVILKILSIIGLNVVAAMKITHFINIFLAGYFMYKLIMIPTENRTSALVTSIFYITVPYFICDILIRDAFAESFIFVFLPIVFIGLNQLINKNYKKFIIYFVLGFTGLVNSHLVMTVYISLLIIIIGLFNIKKILNKKIIEYGLIGIVLILLINLPFFVPMLENKSNTNYAVFEKNMMATPNYVNKNRIEIYDFFALKKENSMHIAKFLNILLVCLAIYSCTKYFKIKNKNNVFLYRSAMILVCISFIFMSKIINWEKMPYFLLMIQFPWRLEICFNFGLCILTGILLNHIKIEDNFTLKLICIISCLVYTINVQQIQSYKNYDINNLMNDSYNSIYKQYMTVTEKPSRLELSEYSKVYREYYPMTTFRSIKYLTERGENVKIVNGNAEIKNINNDDILCFEISNVENASIEIPRLYYLGYTINVEEKSGEKKQIDYYENEEGFIQFNVENDSKVIIKYTGTKLDKFCNFLSFITCVGIITYFINLNFKNKKYKSIEKYISTKGV